MPNPLPLLSRRPCLIPSWKGAPTAPSRPSTSYQPPNTPIACEHGELGALLRREKLYSNQLDQGRREQGVPSLQKWAPGPVSK